MHDFQLINLDTDSISVCKKDGSPFSEEEQEQLLQELNSLFPDTIRWDDDGYYKKIIVLRAKNYILDDGKKVKIKGSALKATGKPPAMKEMIKRIIDALLNDQTNFQEIYLEYVKEAAQIKDIKRWSSRKTISDKTLNNDRTNEARIREAIQGTEFVEGDRVHVFYKDATTLEIVERFNGIYALDKLLKSCYDTIWTFENVIDCNQFINYSLKKSKPLLQELMNEKINA